MPLKIEAMPQLSKPKPLQKGASEEHIFAVQQKAKATAALVAAVKLSNADRRVQRDIDVIAGRSS